MTLAGFFDLKKGTLSVPRFSLVVGPRTGSQVLGALVDEGVAKQLTGDLVRGHVSLPVHLGPSAPEMIVAFSIADSQIQYLSFVLAPEHSTDAWSEWSEAEERRKAEVLDGWLANQRLAQGVTETNWGVVSCGYEPKTGGAEITIRWDDLTEVD